MSTAAVAQAQAPPQRAKVIPTGSQIRIRAHENIDSDNPRPGQLFSAEVTEEVPAKLLIRSETGGAVDSPNLVPDLDAVTINGRVQRVYTSVLKESNDKGLGKNKRTAEFLRGRAVIGGLFRAIFGGGQGAAIGAASGAVVGGSAGKFQTFLD